MSYREGSLGAGPGPLRSYKEGSIGGCSSCAAAGTGEYFSANGVGEYFSANGLGEYFAANGLGEDHGGTAPPVVVVESGMSPTMMAVAGIGGLVVVGGLAFFLMKKKR